MRRSIAGDGSAAAWSEKAPSGRSARRSQPCNGGRDTAVSTSTYYGQTQSKEGPLRALNAFDASAHYSTYVNSGVDSGEFRGFEPI